MLLYVLALQLIWTEGPPFYADMSLYFTLGRKRYIHQRLPSQYRIHTSSRIASVKSINLTACSNNGSNLTTYTSLLQGRDRTFTHHQDSRNSTIPAQPSNSHYSTMAPLPRKALIAITSATKPLHDDKPTGLFISEALHPFLALREAGFEVTLASETGKYTPDSLSLTQDFLNGKDREIWEDETSEFRKLLDGMPKAEDVDASQVSLVNCRRL